MPSLPKTARVASNLAFVMTVLVVALAVITGPIILLVAAPIYFCAGIEIRRGRVWGAYGIAACFLAQILIVPPVISRVPADSNQFVAAAIFSLLFLILFLAAGRSLAQVGAKRGVAWCWIALAVILSVPLLFFHPFVVPTGSMENTMLVGDRFLVEAFPRVTPVRSDIVVFAYPVDPKQTFVKRIVGMPGDRIRIAHKILYRNGVRAEEAYAVHKLAYEDSYRDNFPTTPNTPLYPQAQEMLAKNVTNGEVVVPPGRYFVLGDNRDQSLDSRYWGFVSDGDLIGTAVLIYDSREETTADIFRPAGVLRPARVRWARIFSRPR